MEFRHACADDIDAVCTLYDHAREEPFSVWDETYPLRSDALADLQTENLYILTDGDTVIGALSVVSENESDDLPCWQIRGEGVREIARIVVDAKHHGHGYAAYMVTEICAILRGRGDRAVHISVAAGNTPAQKTYPRVGFAPVGEADIFGGHYVLMEKDLTNGEPNHAT